MTLIETIEQGWKTAAKARDPKKDVLAGIKADVKNRQILDKVKNEGPAPDELVLEVLKKSAKQRRESIEEYKKAARQDLIDKEAAELAIIESYLPAQMSRDEVDAVVATHAGSLGCTSSKDTGRLMKAVMTLLKGKADGRVVQESVKAKLESLSSGAAP